MTEQLIAALITGSILSMLFPTTRSIGIICIAVLTFLFPKIMVVLVLSGVGWFLYSKKSSK